MKKIIAILLFISICGCNTTKHFAPKTEKQVEQFNQSLDTIFNKIIDSTIYK